MRKSILTILLGSLACGLFAQNATAAKNRQLGSELQKSPELKAMPFSAVPDQTQPLDNSSFYRENGTRAGGDLAGQTTYDLGSNGSSPDRLWVYPDGEVSTVFTGSTDLGGSWDDRGTFFNFYDGSAWGSLPTTRVESYRTGFPQMTNLGGIGGTDIFVAHNASNQLALFSSPAGAGTWTEMGSSLTLTGTWPRIASDGSNYVYVIATDFPPPSGPAGLLLFDRSSDGGVTWDIQDALLPDEDNPAIYGDISGESCEIYAQGSNVWILEGSPWNDFALWKSTDNGTTFTRTTIIQSPIEGYNDGTSDSNGDGIADTITTQDGNVALLIDNNGMAHVWCGATYFLDPTAGDGQYFYFPGVSGIWYWNESFGADSVQYLDVLFDWNNDDGLDDPFAGIGASLPSYGCGFTSMCDATQDPTTGRIFLMYTMPVEYTDLYDDPTNASAQSFRDFFGIYSDDYGANWTDPINITYLANQHYENVFPSSTPSTVGDKVHLEWMQDDEPGYSIGDDDPITTADVLYRAFDFSRFDGYAPTPDFSFNNTSGTGFTAFTNLSADADTYSWNFGDGVTSTNINPTHIYAASGTYNACLTAYNHYDNAMTCQDVTVEITGIENTLLDHAISIFPVPASSVLNISIQGNFGNLYADVFNALGERVSATTSITGNTAQVNVSSLPAGNYVLKIYNDKGEYAPREFTVAK